jgi:hypothetical protein
MSMSCNVLYVIADQAQQVTTQCLRKMLVFNYQIFVFKSSHIAYRSNWEFNGRNDIEYKKTCQLTGCVAQALQCTHV